MNLRRNNRSGRHFLPEADVEKYYTGRGRAGGRAWPPRRWVPAAAAASASALLALREPLISIKAGPTRGDHPGK